MVLIPKRKKLIGTGLFWTLKGYQIDDERICQKVI
jgi:hypothetical protein